MNLKVGVKIVHRSTAQIRRFIIFELVPTRSISTRRFLQLRKHFVSSSIVETNSKFADGLEIMNLSEHLVIEATTRFSYGMIFADATAPIKGSVPPPSGSNYSQLVA